PAGDDAIPEGQPANIDIIALDTDGKRAAATGLRWELVRENWQYSWYSVNGSWRHRVQRRDQPMETGTLDVAAGGATLSLSLPAGGTTIELPVDAAWGTGVYALVSAYRPQQAAAASNTGPGMPRGPGRAVGVAWLGIDASPRTLSVALSAPDIVRPRGPTEIGIKVAGLAPNEDAYV